METAAEIFARRLHEERQRAGLSQADLAGLLALRLGRKVDSSAITRLEKGDRRAQLDEVSELAALLKVPLESMLRSPDAMQADIERLKKELVQAQEQVAAAQTELRKREFEASEVEQRLGSLIAIQRWSRAEGYE